jgi:hypothetical protein
MTIIPPHGRYKAAGPPAADHNDNLPTVTISLIARSQGAVQRISQRLQTLKPMPSRHELHDRDGQPASYDKAVELELTGWAVGPAPCQFPDARLVKHRLAV